MPTRRVIMRQVREIVRLSLASGGVRRDDLV